MGRLIIPINFDNDKDLYDYVTAKGNKSEFIRNLISKEMHQESVERGDNQELEDKIERIMRKCLQEYKPGVIRDPDMKNAPNDLQAAASFFDED